MRKITIIIIAILFVSVGFLCGCEEVEKDIGKALGEVVIVSVYAYADVTNSSDVPLDVIQVKFELMKTGGADFTYSVDIGMNGRATCPYVGYNLHEGEIIYVTVSIPGIIGGLSYGSATLTFSNAKNGATDIGNDEWSYQWNPAFNLVADI